MRRPGRLRHVQRGRRGGRCTCGLSVKPRMKMIRSMASERQRASRAGDLRRRERQRASRAGELGRCDRQRASRAGVRDRTARGSGTGPRTRPERARAPACRVHVFGKMPGRIEDYALIGDCQTAALVGRDGSIDWLCLPRFDSGACFAALLGRPDQGRWLLAPRTGTKRITRAYRDGTLILDTTFETEDGAVTVTDCMPLRDAFPRVVRVVRGLRGRVAMHTELILRFDYGSIVPWVRKWRGGGLSAIAGPDTVRLASDVPLRGQHLTSVADFDVAEGDQMSFVLTWHASHAKEPPDIDPSTLVEKTERTWRAWSAKCTYDGPWRDVVLRSLITLKALTHAPTGGIVAAPTTSLPEVIGGPRNWDYRYCWVRDATFTLLALVHNGFLEEARAWREWLLRAVAGDPSKLQIMYAVDGMRRLREAELPWLPGYCGSSPVRVGNAAFEQRQLDVFGEVLDALYQSHMCGLENDANAWHVREKMLDFLESCWDKPDDGIWEVRGPQRQFTHSKVMAWLAFDRGVRQLERTEGGDETLARWRTLRAHIHEEVCRRGVDPEVGAFVQHYGSKKLDASLLMIPLVGFLPATDERVRGTVRAIERHLLDGGFVRRYESDHDVERLPKGEGAFLACSFWLADNWALTGRTADARRMFERLIGLCNDVGLLSEEYDVSAGRLVGNFPQAFSHISLVNAANILHGRVRPRHQC
ncbi:MAG: glycoside hydrolase family 15 protein [Polyangiaceae bacterium]